MRRKKRRAKASGAKSQKTKGSLTNSEYLKQRLEDLKADAPEPLPFDENRHLAFLERMGFPEHRRAKAARLLDDFPKLRAFLESELNWSSRNPVELAAGFIDAVETGQSIPEDSLAWLAHGLRGWFRSKGAKGTLERALSLFSGKAGKKGAYDVAIRRYRDSDLLSDMLILTSLGLSIEKAAELACGRCAEAYPEYAIDVDWLVKKFKRSPYKELKAFLTAMGEELLPADVPEYLRQFPQESIPERMRPLLRQPASKPN